MATTVATTYSIIGLDVMAKSQEEAVWLSNTKGAAEAVDTGVVYTLELAAELPLLDLMAG